MEASFDLGTIEDVDIGTREFIRRRWGRKFYIIGGFLIVVAVVGATIDLGLFVFPALIWFSAGWTIAHKLVQFEFMRQFAEKNGFTYEAAGDIATVHGDLFARGHSRSVTCVVSGARNGFPIRFFLYTYTVGSGKHKHTEHFTVMEAAFKGSVPPVILDNREDRFTDDGINRKHRKHRKLSTGNRFDDHFTLRVVEGHEIEALEVFTPEVMEDVIAHGKGHSFEFVGHNIYVWKTGHAKRSAELNGLMNLAHYLVDTLSMRLSRLHDDVDAVTAAHARREHTAP